MIVDKLAIGIVQTLSPFYYLRSPALVFPFPGKTISVSSVISVAKYDFLENERLESGMLRECVRRVNCVRK